MKLTTNLSFKKILALMSVLIAFFTTGTNTLHLKDLGKELLKKTKGNAEGIDQIFFEKSSSEKKKKKKYANANAIANSYSSKAYASKAYASKGKIQKKSRTESKESWAGGTLNTPDVAGGAVPFKNDTLSRASWRDINNTYVAQKINVFMFNNRKWDFKLLDKQLQDIAFDMNYQQEYGHTPEGLRAFIKYFINYFEACDQDQDMQLSKAEFQGCLTNDSFLSIIDVPTRNYSALTVSPYNYTNITEYGNNLFELLDPLNTNYLNFHSYMHLRLFIFSWRRCSVAAPFLEESNFECAIEISAGWKSMSRNQARKLFFLGLELSGSESLRNLDFVTYVSIAQAVRLYGKINGKEDNDITVAEMNLALDNNILPIRYNQDIIGYFFKLIEERDKANQGMDLLTFVFYDFWLKLFNKYENTRKYYLTYSEYVNIFSNPLYPKIMIDEIKKIPQNNLTTSSYQMYTYLNISNYQDESDHFLKSFLETSTSTNLKSEKSLNKWSINEAVNNQSAFAFNVNTTMLYMFKLIDQNSDGFINFYDFGGLMQVNYLFAKFDIYQKGRIVAGDLFENFTSYSNFPLVNYLIRERAKKFNLFPQDLYTDLYSAVLTLKIEDLINAHTRRLDKSTLFEVELKNIFAMINRQFVPDAFLNRCLRGVSADNIPLYDWECSYIQSETRTLTFYENSFDRLTAAANNITLFNTVFYNIESNLPQQGSIRGEFGPKI